MSDGWASFEHSSVCCNWKWDFWLLYLGLVLVGYTGKVLSSTVFKTLGLSTGVLQELLFLIPAALLYEVFDEGVIRQG